MLPERIVPSLFVKIYTLKNCGNRFGMRKGFKLTQLPQ